jgi:hypothetical protein
LEIKRRKNMIRKNENFTISIVKDGGDAGKCGSVEYKMSAALANLIMKIHKGPKKNKQEVLVNYVNTQLGLKDKCVRVLVDLD